MLEESSSKIIIDCIVDARDRFSGALKYVNMLIRELDSMEIYRHFSIDVAYSYAVGSVISSLEFRGKDIRAIVKQAKLAHEELLDMGVISCELPDWQYSRKDELVDKETRRVPIITASSSEAGREVVKRILHQNQEQIKLEAWMAVWLIGIVGVDFDDVFDLRFSNFYICNAKLYFTKQGYFDVVVHKRYTHRVQSYLAYISRVHNGDYVFPLDGAKTRSDVRRRIMQGFSNYFTLNGFRVQCLSGIAPEKSARVRGRKSAKYVSFVKRPSGRSICEVSQKNKAWDSYNREVNKLKVVGAILGK